jgi:hypothetical protein
MLSELHNLNSKLFSKQYNKNFVLHLIVVPQLSSGWQHNNSTKTRQVGWANEQSMYSLMSIVSFSLLFWLGGMQVLLACPSGDVIFAQLACPLN